MKYLFYVHSQLTLLVSLQLIKELELSSSDCTLLLARGMQAHAGIKSVVFPYKHLPKETFSVSFAFWKTWAKMKELDAWLMSLTDGQPFHYYTPQSRINFFYVIVSNPSCKGFSYIEEGRTSYFPSTALLSKKKAFFLRDWFYSLNFKGRSKSQKHFFDQQHPKYHSAYAISEWTFPDLPNKQQLQLPFQKKNFEENYQKILVFEPLAEFGITTIETLLFALEQLLEHHVKEGVLHYKYHPAQKDEQSKNAIESLFSAYTNSHEFKEIPAEISLEEVAVSSQAEFYVISSSVGLYAQICGRPVYSIARYLVMNDPGFQLAIDDLPSVYKEQLTFL